MNAHNIVRLLKVQQNLFSFFSALSLSHIINSLGQWPISASSAHLLAIDRHLVNFASVISLFRIARNTISALKIVYACEFFSTLSLAYIARFCAIGSNIC